METIKVKVKTKRPKTEIKKIENDIYYINLKSAPEKGKANKELINFLSKHFKKRVQIIKGLKSKEKIIKL